MFSAKPAFEPSGHTWFMAVISLVVIAHKESLASAHTPAWAIWGLISAPVIMLAIDFVEWALANKK